MNHYENNTIHETIFKTFSKISMKTYKFAKNVIEKR